MKINISNYEEFFLLYIDNELSITDRKEVELFIQENPVYAKELTKLAQTVLETVHIEYEDKSLLYRFDEMNTTLPVTFKQGLYRNETPIIKGFFTPARILSIGSIAAIFIIFIGYRFLNNNTTAAIASTTYNSRQTTNRLAKNFESPTSKSPINEYGIVQSNQKKITFTIPTKQQSNISNTDNPISSILSAQQNNEITQVATPIAENMANKYISSIETTELPSNKQPIIEASTIANNTIAPSQSETYENINTEDPDRIIYIANLEINGDKLRGFSRRINALLNRNKTEKEK